MLSLDLYLFKEGLWLWVSVSTLAVPLDVTPPVFGLFAFFCFSLSVAASARNRSLRLKRKGKLLTVTALLHCDIHQFILTISFINHNIKFKNYVLWPFSNATTLSLRCQPVTPSIISCLLAVNLLERDWDFDNRYWLLPVSGFPLWEFKILEFLSNYIQNSCDYFGKVQVIQLTP